MGVMKPYLDVGTNGSGWQELELRNLTAETRIKTIVKAINRPQSKQSTVNVIYDPSVVGVFIKNQVLSLVLFPTNFVSLDHFAIEIS